MIITLPAALGSPPRFGIATVYRWELEKLTAQWRVRLIALVAVLGPFAAAAALAGQQQTPSDTLFGRWVHVSGSAVPLLILAFVTQYAAPLIIALVAGDIFATEDHYGTWKMILTRSQSRASVFWGKTLAAATYTVVVVGLLALSSTAAGLLIVGHQSLIGLNGTLIGAGHATGLVLLSWASILPPALGFTAVALLFSIATRNAPAGIVGPVVLGGLMQVYGLVGTDATIRTLLLCTPFDAWHGLFASHPYHGSILSGLVVSAVYAVVGLSAGYLLLRRRDFTQG